MKRNGWFSTTKYKILPTCGTDKKDESTDKPILCTLPETKTRDGLRPEIQGLRAIAIVSVLCFHMWGDVFKVGFLGVDCFFVISGYLMIMIMLGRKDNLTLSGTATFYFRRIKRIVPIYVFVIALTLILCYLLISDFEFGQVATEAVPSLLFYSNFPFVHKTSYFDLKSRYQFFLHTWSLSCELQFYLFVPLLMLIIGILTNIHFCLTLLFIFTLSIASFYRQVISTSNAKHMTLDARVWQFLFGFFAHFVYQSNFLDWTSKPNQSTCCRLFCWLRNKTPTILLILLLLFPITNLMEGQLQRLLVVFLTALIIAIKQNDSVLSSDMLVNLGDVSYSVYLIHWPIFTMHRRLDPDSYDNGKDANHIVGSYLVGVSICVGYLIESKFKRVLLYVKNWRHLIKLLFILYLAAGLSVWILERDALTLIKVVSSNNRVGGLKRINDTLMLYRTRKNETVFSNKEAMAYNAEIAYTHQMCAKQSSHLPSGLKQLSVFDERICHDVGNGTKNIIVLGNSHAYLSFFAIVNTFRPIARNITLMSVPACRPGEKQHQLSTLNDNRRNVCVKFMKNSLEAIQKWHFDIHVVIPLFGWHDYVEFSNDEYINYQRELQKFYDTLSNVTQEVVFAPTINLMFSKQPLLELQNKLRLNRTFERIGESREKIHSFQPRIRQIMKKIECQRCLKINWMDLWCEDVFCPTSDHRHIAYFLDEHHPTTFGNMFIAKFLRDAYENHMREQSINK